MSIEPKRNVYDRQAQTWALYAETMATAGRAALAFADAISAYLRGGMSCYRGFDEACRAADAYGIAVEAASEWHFGCIQRHGSGIIINCQADELVALMRELRGTAVPVTLRNNNRTLASFRYADARMLNAKRCAPTLDASATVSIQCAPAVIRKAFIYSRPVASAWRMMTVFQKAGATVLALRQSALRVKESDMATNSSGKAAIDALLTEYRRMCPQLAGQAGYGLRITQEHDCEKCRTSDKIVWRTRVEVYVGASVVCDGVGPTAEDAAEDALETLRKAGVSF